MDLHTVKPVYSSHPWNTACWLLYGGDLLIQCKHYTAVLT